MLYGATDAQIRAYATPIYNRLASFDAFSPISANAVCDWSVQAGDIIEIIIDDVTYVFARIQPDDYMEGRGKASLRKHRLGRATCYGCGSSQGNIFWA